ncbi:hypothetical protein Tco_1025705 [Tanacetum coccineum]
MTSLNCEEHTQNLNLHELFAYAANLMQAQIQFVIPFLTLHQCPTAKKDFMDYHLPREWEIARDAELSPFKDVLVF